MFEIMVRTMAWVLYVTSLGFSLVAGIMLYSLWRDVFSPHVLLIATYSAYTLVLPIWVLTEASSPGYTVDGLPAYLLAQISGLLGIVCACVFVTFARSALHVPIRVVARVPKWKGLPSDASGPSLALGAVLWVVAGWLLMAERVRLFGGLSAFLRMGYTAERYVMMSSRGYLGFATDWLLVGYGLISGLVLSGSWKRLTRGCRVTLIFAAATGILWLYTLIRIGGRGAVLRLFLVILLQIHYLARPLKPASAVLAFLPLYTALVMYGHVRSLLAMGSLGTVLLSAWGRLLSQPALLLPTSFGEFINPARALYDLANRTVDFSPLLGRTYVNIPWIFLPKAILPNRPLTASEWYVWAVNPALAAAGGGLGFCTAAEGYLNFGTVGVFVHMFVYSLAFIGLYRALWKNRCIVHKAYKVVALIIVYSVVAEAGMRIDVAPVLKTITLGYVLPLWSVPLLASLLRGPAGANKQARLGRRVAVSQ